jgi:hypothetical protein
MNNAANIKINIRCDQLKNKSSRRVTYGNPCYSIGSKADSICFLNDRSVLLGAWNFGQQLICHLKKNNVPSPSFIVINAITINFD